MTLPHEETIAIVVKGYPRLSETFIAQEILALEERGLSFEIWSLRHPSEKIVHPMHRKIRAKRAYLPEYLYQEPWRVLKGIGFAMKQPAFGSLLASFWRDLKRDPSANRLRRFGQACVFARELPHGIRHVHVHYLHTPASVVRYAAHLTNRGFTFSAHAKDIWTTPDWEKREKIADALWGVTCTRQGSEALRKLSRNDTITLLYHGLDLGRFPDPPQTRPLRDGTSATDPVRIVAVGRAVEKKGFDDLLRALAALPADLHWQFAHVGSGELLDDLKELARKLGIASRCVFLGSQDQTAIVSLLREADLFALPARQAETGDRDGLPNVILEAASQGLALVATQFAGIPEFVRDGVEGVLVPPGDWEALSNSLNELARAPEWRAKLGQAAYDRLRNDFSTKAGIDELERRFRAILEKQQHRDRVDEHALAGTSHP